MAQAIINGIIKTENGYAIKNFLEPDKKPIDVGDLSFPSYDVAVNYLSNLLYPESYRPYLLAVKDMVPDNDTWNNLMFIGHAYGYFDHEAQKFKNARQLNMNAANDFEITYLEALGTTYQSLLKMLKK